jgi:RNA polymerase sigma-70 factor (ECF subfamily)
VGDSSIDVALAGRIRAGDRQAEAELCRRYIPRIAGYGAAHLRDRQAIDDLLQEVLVIVLQALRAGRVDTPERLGSYVLSTCRHRVWEKNRGREHRPIDDEVATVLRYETDWIHLERERVEHCLSRLGLRERTIVVETFCNETPTDELAAQLGLTPGNVRVIRHRTLAQLLACVQGGAS